MKSFQDTLSVINVSGPCGNVTTCFLFLASSYFAFSGHFETLADMEVSPNTTTNSINLLERSDQFKFDVYANICFAGNSPQIARCRHRCNVEPSVEASDEYYSDDGDHEGNHAVNHPVVHLPDRYERRQA